MTVKITKPALNLREELNKLDKPSGITGESLLRADTAADAKKTLGIDNFEQVSVSTDGVISADGLRVDTGGTIGIGTSSPARPLHVVGTGETARFESTNATSKIVIKDNLASNEITSVNGKLSIEADTAGLISNSRIDFKIDNSEVARFTDTGRLGLGVTAPTTTLHVDGEARFYRSNGASNTYTFESDHFASIQITGDMDSSSGGPFYNKLVTSGSNGRLEFRANDVAKMTMTQAGSVGIGSTGPSQKLHVEGGNVLVKESATAGAVFLSNTSVGIKRSNAVDSANARDIEVFTDGAGGNVILSANGAGSAEFVVSDSGRVGIGTSSPTQKLHLQDGQTQLLVEGTNSSVSGLVAGVGVKAQYYRKAGFTIFDESNNEDFFIGRPYGSTNQFAIINDGNERLRISAAGKVGIGTSNPLESLDVRGKGYFNNGGALYVDSQSSGVLFAATGASRNIAFEANGARRLDIKPDGKVGIGTTSPQQALHVASSGSARIRIQDTDTAKATASSLIEFNGSDGRGAYMGVSTGAFVTDLEAGTRITWSLAGSEKMRIDSSGNLLVGTTDTNVSDNTTGGGININGDGEIKVAKNGTVLNLNRLATDGEIVRFKKGGTTTVGSINAYLSGLAVGTNDTGLFFQSAYDRILPFNVSTNAGNDDLLDLGASTNRFDDIYATNGTIQTSDRNEKQDIEALSDAEQRVAVAAKGLLRKFRWKSSVADKGDEARIHFGIIAQDLQAAFEAEGLDAGRYAMFINSTWTDEETGEERSRMGVRYSELLAFIISAI